VRRGEVAQRRLEHGLGGGAERLAGGRVEARRLGQRRLEDGAADF